LNSIFFGKPCGESGERARGLPGLARQGLRGHPSDDALTPARRIHDRADVRAGGGEPRRLLPQLGGFGAAPGGDRRTRHGPFSFVHLFCCEIWRSPDFSPDFSIALLGPGFPPSGALSRAPLDHQGKFARPHVCPDPITTSLAKARAGQWPRSRRLRPASRMPQAKSLANE
jgi:hypothetical protein